MKAIKYLTILLFQLSSIPFLQSQVVANNQDDYTALRAFYLASDGDSWNFDAYCVDPDCIATGEPCDFCYLGGCGVAYFKSWPTAQEFLDNPIIPEGTNMNNWYGVNSQKVSAQERVVELNFSYILGETFQATLPPEIGLLSELIYLEISSAGVEGISGTIPSEIGNLTKLRSLILENMVSLGLGLTGTIPNELFTLSNLNELDLSDNSLTGGISDQIGNLTNLTYLDLSENQLSGIIPSTIGDLTNLTCLNLKSNDLSGVIPTTLSNLTSLNSLKLSDNNLSGPLTADYNSLCSNVVWMDVYNGNSLDPDWATGCSSLILDLSISNFKAVSKSNENLISWSLNSESSYDYYVLEYSSDLENWKELAKYDNDSELNQTFSHFAVEETSYYRLKSFEHDGRIINSSIISVKNDSFSSSAFSLYPLPAKEVLQVLNNSDESITISISDLLGKTIYSLILNANSLEEIEVSEWANGLYYISSLHPSKTIKSKTFIVSH